MILGGPESTRNPYKVVSVRTMFIGICGSLDVREHKEPTQQKLVIRRISKDFCGFQEARENFEPIQNSKFSSGVSTIFVGLN